MTTPIFTRYLYEKTQVEESLRDAILERHREESLFWAYELYYSGFKREVWQIVMNVYLQYYAGLNPNIQSKIDKFYMEWQETGNECLLGTVVGTLAINNDQFIILYKEPRHQTMEEVGFPARHYLKHVSRYFIRKTDLDVNINNAYLGDWLYYCRKTPVWKTRIESFGGRIEENGKIVFETDEQFEQFYDKWGFEPDEQPMEIHNAHGVYLLE